MGEQGNGRREGYEPTEAIIVLIVTVVLTLADFLLIQTDKKIFDVKGEQLFQGFLLSLIATSFVSVLIRMYVRHNELMDALDNFRALNRDPVIAGLIGKIGKICQEIQEDQWKRYASQLLGHRLSRLNGFAEGLRAGTVQMDLYEGQELSPSFFNMYPGPCFATSYADVDYWEAEDGKRQLDSNRNRLSHNPDSVIRIFFLPPYAHRPFNGSLDSFESVLKEQLDARVKVYVVLEKVVLQHFRRDVGVFFTDRREMKIGFVSEWVQSGDYKFAMLTFDEFRLDDFQKMYEYLIGSKDRPGTAREIRTMEDWKDYKSNLVGPVVSVDPPSGKQSPGNIE